MYDSETQDKFSNKFPSFMCLYSRGGCVWDMKWILFYSSVYPRHIFSLETSKKVCHIYIPCSSWSKHNSLNDLNKGWVGYICSQWNSKYPKILMFLLLRNKTAQAFQNLFSCCNTDTPKKKEEKKRKTLNTW